MRNNFGIFLGVLFSCSRIDDLSGIKKLNQLEEFSLDGNDVLMNEDCVLFVTSYVPSVQIFGQTKITKDVRNVAKIWRLRKEFSENLGDISLDADIGRSMRKMQPGASCNRNVSQLRKRGNDNVKNDLKKPNKCTNQSSLAGQSATSYNKTAKARRACFTKKKNRLQ